jgi:predicted N-acyltransferase
MEVTTKTSIIDIDEQQWENIVTPDIEQSYAWYKTIEDSGVQTMYYIVLTEDTTVTAAACCHLYTHKIFTKTLPFIEVGSPLGLSKAFFSTHEYQTRMLIKGLETLQTKEKAKGLLLLDFKKREFQHIKDQLKGFSTVHMPENTYLDLHFTDFDDYLSSLDGKTRRSIRITLNKAKKLNIKTVTTNEFSQYAPIAYNLQGYTCQYHNDYSKHLPLQFYTALERHLKERAELVFCFKYDTPLAFALVLNTPDTAQYKFSGVDPHYREYHAYFLLYYQGIKRALEKNQNRIYFGATTYAFKEKIGCNREEFFGAVKLKNPLLNLGLKSLLKIKAKNVKI